MVEAPPKSRQSRRLLSLLPAALGIFARQQERQRQDRLVPRWQDTGFIWTGPTGEPRGNSWLSNGLTRILGKAGLPRVRLHDLRHSTASILMEQGIAVRVVADLLGHSQVSLTLGTYSHVTERLVGDATAAMGALVTPVSSPIVAQIVAVGRPDQLENTPTTRIEPGYPPRDSNPEPTD